MAGFRADTLKASDDLRRRILKACLIAGGTGLAIAIFTCLLLWNTLFAQMPTLPSNEHLWAMNREPAIEFQDADGNTLEIRGPRYGRKVAASDLPPHVLHAFLAVEDKRFYQHEGVDRMAILRAAFANWRAGETVQGGSTLTQQLVKNLFLSSERTLKRKAQEARLAFDLEQRLSKEEILELYINRIYLGSRSYGLSAASQTYFGKDPQELSISEAALIAGLPQAPSRYSPFKNLDLALERRNLVIDRMAESNFITAALADRAKLEEVTLIEEKIDPRLGYVLDAAAERAREMLPNNAPDMVVTLSIDPELQRQASDLLKAKLAEVAEEKNVEQGALVIMDAKTGAIRALVGGRDYEESQFNRATQALRQPGSSFKAFVFAAALENGLHPHTVRVDDPISIDGWKPQNYGGHHVGAITLSEAFATSLNTIAASLGQELGMDTVINLAHRFGINAEIQDYPSTSLGSEEVPLIEITTAYGVFATGGKRFSPWIVRDIRNSRGELLFTRYPEGAEPKTPQQIFAPQLNKNMVGMMARVVTSGTGKAARLAMPEPEADPDEVRSSVPRAKTYRDTAGKTGTSQDWRDALFVGFTADYVGGVWVGNDDDTPMEKVTGGDVPAHIWHDMMILAHADLPATPLPGAEAANALTTEAEKRLAFYRSMADAFAIVENRGLR